MRYKVRLTHRNGVELTRDELLASPVLDGELIIEELKPPRTGRFQRIATLLVPDRTQYAHELCRPIFDPVVVRLGRKTGLYLGTELETKVWVTTVQPQGWLFRLADTP